MCLMVGGQRQVDVNISINKRKHHGDARPSVSCLAYRVVPVSALLHKMVVVGYSYGGHQRCRASGPGDRTWYWYPGT